MIRTSGLLSGFDSRSLVSQLMQIERQPVDRMRQKMAGVRATDSHLGKLSSAVTALKDMLEGMQEEAGLLAFSATSSDEDMVTVSASSDASPGTYSVDVLSLAKAEKNRSQAFASSSDAVKEGTLDITVGSDATVSVALDAGDTLEDVRDAINSSGAAVSASIIKAESGDYLQLDATEAGYDTAVGTDAIQLTETYTGATGTELALTEIVSASNARVSVDGLTIARRSNTISDAIDGLTFELKQVSTGTEVRVEADVEGVTEKATEFVDAYNNLQKLLRADASEDIGFASALSTQLTDLVLGSVNGTSSDLDTLKAIGIELGSFGALKLDSDTLEDTLSSDPNALAQLFQATGDGLSSAFVTLFEDYTEGSDNIFSTSKKVLQDRLRSMEDSIDAKERRLTRTEASLVRQFNSMEQAMQQLQAMQGQLGAFL